MSLNIIAQYDICPNDFISLFLWSLPVYVICLIKVYIVRCTKVAVHRLGKGPKAFIVLDLCEIGGWTM